jgi:hypothetical protein
MRKAESASCSMAEEDELDERANSGVAELRGRVVSQRFLAAEVWKGNRRKDAIEVRRERKGGRTH